MITISTLSVLKKVVLPTLHEYGFEYSGKKDSVSWVFTRKVGEISQYVSFEKTGSNPNRIRFVLSTSVSLETMYTKDLAKGVPDSFVYDDDVSFNSVLETLKNIIISKGIDWLKVSLIYSLIRIYITNFGHIYYPDNH